MSRSMFSFAPTNKTVFRTTTSSTISTGSSASAVDSTGTCIESDYYHTLAKSVTKISDIFYQYSLGNYRNVSNLLNIQAYNELSQTLYSLKKRGNTYPYYEVIRLTFVRCLEGILQSINQYSILNNTKDKLAAALKKASILDDLELLKQYIKSLKGATTIFPSSTVQTIAAQIKPEYSYYIKRWGYPKGGIFEMDKLAIAIQNTQFSPQ